MFVTSSTIIYSCSVLLNGVSFMLQAYKQNLGEKKLWIISVL